MDPRPLSIEELRRLAPAARARYLGELARANLEQERRRVTEEDAGNVGSAVGRGDAS